MSVDPPKDVTVVAGEKAVLECNHYNWNIPPQFIPPVIWEEKVTTGAWREISKDNVVTSGHPWQGQVTFEKTYNLVFVKVSTNHAGRYRCQYENSGSYRVADLFVVGKLSHSEKSYPTRR